jgi:hypothetical protein
MICPKATKEGGCIDLPGTRNTCSKCYPHLHHPSCNKAEEECPACIPYIPEEQPKKLCPECGHPISEHDSRDNWCHHIVPNDPCECGCVGKSYPADLKPAEPKKFSEMSSCEYLGCKYASRDEKGKPYCKDTNEYKNAAGEPVCGLRDDALIMEDCIAEPQAEMMPLMFATLHSLGEIIEDEFCSRRRHDPCDVCDQHNNCSNEIKADRIKAGILETITTQRDADMDWHNSQCNQCHSSFSLKVQQAHDQQVRREFAEKACEDLPNDGEVGMWTYLGKDIISAECKHCRARIRAMAEKE